MREELEALLHGSGTKGTSILDDAVQVRTNALEFASLDAGSGGERNERLVQHLSDLEDSASPMSKCADVATAAARRAVKSIAAVATSMLSQTTGLRSELDSRVDLNEEYRAMSARGADFIARHRKADSSSVQVQERLRELIDRFTTLSHKQIVSVGGTAVEAPTDEEGSSARF